MKRFLNNKRWDIIVSNKVACMPEWDWYTKKNNWVGYHLWYVVSGEATVETNGRITKLLEGDVYLFNLLQAHYCQHNPDKPLTVLTVYFRESEELHQNYSQLVDSTKLIYDNPMFVRKLFENLRADFESVNREGALIWLNAILSEQLLQLKTSEVSRIMKIVNTINNKPTYPYTLSYLANRCGYSINHFLRLFKQEIGVTPMTYCLQVKMNLAKHYILYSNYTINEIAILCGYKDVAYFSKQFKQLSGMSPSVFRNAFMTQPVQPK